MLFLNRLLICFFIFSVIIGLVNAGFGFLKDQRQCLVKCQNHGVCAYEIGNPQVHRCICMTNMYYGDLCQYTVTQPPPTQRILITTTTPESTSRFETHQRPIKIVPQSLEESIEAEEEKEDMVDESENEKSSYLTLDDNTGKKSVEIEPADDKSVEIDKTDDYFEPAVEGPAASTELHPEAVTNSGHVVSDTQMGQYQSKKQKTTHSVERDDAIEEEESWMMVKKKGNSAFRCSLDLFSLVIFTALSFIFLWL